jgi:hypothetical protein
MESPEVACLSAGWRAKVGAIKVKRHRGRPYTGMPLMSSVLISILYGCAPAASNAPIAMGSERLTIASPSGEGKAMHVASSSDLPEWMQSALKDPDPEVRLKVLEKWIEQNESGIGPAMLVINDPDARVRAKAMQVIERAWATEQRAIQNMR